MRLYIVYVLMRLYIVYVYNYVCVAMTDLTRMQYLLHALVNTLRYQSILTVNITLNIINA